MNNIKYNQIEISYNLRTISNMIKFIKSFMNFRSVARDDI